jgi:V-type H+-transporting ATPase subunit C
MGMACPLPRLNKGKMTKFQNELVRITKSAFSDTFQAWTHLKALRVFVESVLRYGLPPEFVSAVIKVLPPQNITD